MFSPMYCASWLKTHWNKWLDTGWKQRLRIYKASRRGDHSRRTVTKRLFSTDFNRQKRDVSASFGSVPFSPLVRVVQTQPPNYLERESWE